MATKNFVPRATGEGQLGTDSKKWDKHIAISGAYSYVSASSKGSFGFLEASNILFELDDNGDIMPV